LLGLIVTAPSLAGFIAFSPHSLSLMIVFGLIVGLGLSSVDTGARWPIAQGVLRPELRATGRAALDMVIGVVGATVVALSGRLVDQVGVTTMMLILIPIPKLLGAISWLPIFWTYPRDRQELHEALARRREALARGWAEATGVDRAAAEQAPAQP
jgi:MFS family permease